MRFYTQRCKPTRRFVGGPQHAARYASVMSNRCEVIDGNGDLKIFTVHENDAEYVCAALNAADRQGKSCTV